MILLLIGYGLQGLGHRLEGNDMGEVLLLKKRLGKPYLAVAPRYQTGTPPRPDTLAKARTT